MPGNLKGQYQKLANDRSVYLNEARRVVNLTVPQLLRQSDMPGAPETLAKPFNSMGARAVNNLASKLLLTLFPINIRFFKYILDEFAARKIPNVDDKVISQTKQTLSEMEGALIQEIETESLRVVLFEALLHVVVTGNVLINIRDEGARNFFLDSYVITRDPRDHVLFIITKELVDPKSLSEEMQKAISRPPTNPEEVSNQQEWVEVYTGIRRKDKDTFIEWQEIEGVRVGDPVEIAEEQMNWLPIRMHRISGESYGRGHATLFSGDLQSLEGLTQAVVSGAAAAAKLLILVDPVAFTQLKDLGKAPNGAIRRGRKEDVTFVTTDKDRDFAVAERMITKIEQRLGFAFLLNSTVPRNAERVTAEEIRFVADELDATLSGSFSLLSTELQLPIVRILTSRMIRDGRFPPLLEGIVRPAIVTGLDAIGRGQDLQRLDGFLAGALQTLGPEVVAQWVIVGEYLTRRATAIGIKTDGLIRPPEEVQRAQQQQMLLQLSQSLGPEAIKQFAPQITQAVEAVRTGTPSNGA